MVDYLSRFSKNIVQQTIEQTFPLTDEIALIAAGAGWYAYRYIMTHSQKFMTDATTYQFTQWFSGTVFESYSPLLAHFFTPVYVPSVSPEAATYIGLGVYVSTCFTLNLIAKGIFGIKGEKNPQNKLPEALQKIGIDLPPPPLNKIPEDRIEITPIQLEVAPIKKEESPQSEQENFNHIASPPIEEPKRYSLKNHPGFAPTMNAINPPNNEQNVTLPLEDSFADSEEESATKKGFCSFNFCFKK